MAQEYFVVYGQDAESEDLLYFVADGLQELMFDLGELAAQLPDSAAVSHWLTSFFVFPEGTNAEKAAAECPHFIIEGKPGDEEPVFPAEVDDEEDDVDE